MRPALAPFDVRTLRREYPALHRLIQGRPLAYLDSAASSLTPRVVIDAVCKCYQISSGSVGRGVHALAEEATQEYEAARESIADFINADSDEIIFVRNATEAINVVVRGIPSRSVVLGSVGDHHSNILSWRDQHRYVDAELTPDGRIDPIGWSQKLNEHGPSIVTFCTVGNAFGNVNPVDEIIDSSHRAKADVLLDASQSISHVPVDVRQLDCEYLCFSGHKLGGPTGIGVLYVKRDRLDGLQPLLLGGGMVDEVGRTSYALVDAPQRLEAGTPSFEAAIGLSAACEFLRDIGLDAIHEYETRLTQTLIDLLRPIRRVTIHGPLDAKERGSIVSFSVDGLESHGVARMLSSRFNVFVRSGFHCAQPAHDFLGTRPTIRASVALYNNEEDVGALARGLQRITENMA